MAPRIVGLRMYPVVVPMQKPLPMASGTIERCGNVLIELMSDFGVSGWGEAVEAPALTGETQESIESELARLIPSLLGVELTSALSIWDKIEGHLGGAARGAIDIACHDLLGRLQGVPAYQLLGRARRRVIPALSLVGSGVPDADLATIRERQEAGYYWFKLKVGLSDPESEAATVLAAADWVGRSGMLCADANGAWSESEAARFLDRVAGSRLRYLEQPLASQDLDASNRLASRYPVPLCADESAPDLESLAYLRRAGFRGVSLKLIKHGGMTGVIRAGRLVRRAGLAVNLAGKVAETSIAAAANLHCAAALGGIAFGCSPANQGIGADVTLQAPTPFRGRYRVPEGPGLGIEVDRGLVEAITGRINHPATKARGPAPADPPAADRAR